MGEKNIVFFFNLERKKQKNPPKKKTEVDFVRFLLFLSLKKKRGGVISQYSHSIKMGD